MRTFTIIIIIIEQLDHNIKRLIYKILMNNKNVIAIISDQLAHDNMITKH